MSHTRFGEYVSRQRRVSHLSQQGLADKAGVGKSTIARIERSATVGAHNATLERVAIALGAGSHDALIAAWEADTDLTPITTPPTQRAEIHPRPA